MQVPTKSQLIDNMPEPMLSATVNALGGSYRVSRYSRRMRNTLVEWRGLESLSKDAVRAYQLQRFRHIIQAAARTPYYARVFREVRFDPHNVSSIGDLQRLPILSRSDLMLHADEMLVPGYERRVVKRRSSGTTGQPVLYTQPRRMAYAENYAMLYQFYGWHGFKPLGRRATMAGRYMGHRREGVVVRNWLENQLILGVHSLTSSSVARYLDALEEFRPELLQAHPSALTLLKQLAETVGLPPPKVPLVSFTAETLLETERRILSTWLGDVPIFGTYGSGENVMAGGECPALDGYHIHPAVGICELVEHDGSQEIVGTSLLNDSMPLLRYRTGDFATAITDSSCSCGCAWPRLLEIQGRMDDRILTTDGRPVAPVVLRTGISALGVLNSPYSIIQHAEPRSYTLLIYRGTHEDGAEELGSVLAYLRSTLGKDSRLSVRFTPTQEMLTSRGKHRIVIRENR